MSVSVPQVTLLVLFSFLLTSGQVLFKLAANYSTKITTFVGFAALLANPYVWMAGALYGGGTLLWIYILQQVPLSRAYPFVALGFVLVPFISHYLFGESISLRFLAGSGLIVIGIYFAALAPA